MNPSPNKFTSLHASPPNTQRPPVFNVPRTSANILDFSPQSNTAESDAMLALLSPQPGNNAVALVGIGGAGKTTILMAIGRHPAIWDAFQHGIWFIQLGHDVTLQTFLDSLKELVQDAIPDFFEKFVSLAASEKSHVRMINDLLDRLEHRNFLLIFDDVWYGVPGVDKLVRTVYTAVQEMDSGSLKVLASTRDWGVGCKPSYSLSIDANPVASNVQTAHQILCYHAGLDVKFLHSLSNADRDALRSVVNMCAGLPLALSLAGSSIREMMAPPEAGRLPHGHFVRFWERFERNVDALEKNDSVGDKGLFASIRSTLQILEAKWSRREISMESMFRSLSVLTKQSMIPLRALEKVWGLDRRGAEEGVLMMSRYNIASAVTDGTNEIVGLRMHDLVHDVSVNLAQKSEGVCVWHSRLIDGYVFSGKVGECDGREKRYHGWWMLKEDGYMRDNIVRHLVGAGRGGEALGLLTDFRWIEHVNEDEKRTAFQKVISDMELLSKYMKKLEDVEMGEKLSRDIDVIIRTMELCMVPYCIENRAECAFQMQGRLASLGSDSDVVKRLLSSIERYARRPWVRGRTGMLTSAMEKLKRVLPVSVTRLMEQGVGSDEVIVGGYGGAQVMSTRDGSKIFDFEKSETRVKGICVDKARERIYLCERSGKVEVWGRSEQLCAFQFGGLNQNESIQCTHLQGQVMVAGSSHGRLMVMDVATGETIRTIDSHTGPVVWSFAGGRCGDVMVSFCDVKMRLWDTSTFDVKWEVDVGDEDGRVRCVAMSGDECLIATGCENGIIELWDVRLGRKTCSPLTGHTGDVLSFAFSGDDRLLYSGGNYEIIVWDVSNVADGVPLVQKFVHETVHRVRSLFVSADHSELFALGHRGISVWDARMEGGEDEAAGESGVTFFDNVASYGVSADGKTIMTRRKGSKTLEMRDVGEVSEGIEEVIARYEMEFDVPNYLPPIPLAVSDNRRLVAFSSGYEIEDECCNVVVVDVESGTMLHTFFDLREWAKHLIAESKYYYGSFISSISFTADGCIAAEAFVDCEEKSFTNALSWDLTTGELVGDIPSPTSTDPSSGLTCLKSSQRYNLSYSPTVLHRTGSDSSKIVATLEHESLHVHYTPTTSRLWVLKWGGGLDYLDVITEETPTSHLPQPALPMFPERHPEPSSSPRQTASKSRQSYDVFISHAGAHKWLARKLRKAMCTLGLHVFVDEDSMSPDDRTSHEKMHEAIETARAGLFILSRQFGERTWTILELEGFLGRRRENEGRGIRGPVLVPFFFSMEWEDARRGTMKGYFVEMLGAEVGERVARSLEEIAVYTGVRREEGDSTEEIVDIVAGRMEKALRDTYGESGL